MNHPNPFPFNGLSNHEVITSRKKFGGNIITSRHQHTFWHSLKDAITEPMFILLVAAAIIYFVVGEYADAWFMSGAIILVSAISIYQDNRSRNALQSLKEFTQPYTSVIRNNQVQNILSKEIVVGDYVVVSEGHVVPADGKLKQYNDFTVNESILTGESLAVSKDLDGNDALFSGTLAASGQAVFEVTAVGDFTKLAKLGISILEIKKEKTILQKQISSFVKWMAVVGAIIFLLIWGINFYQSNDILDSLLKGLTIAMSVLPEEIPVALATFMALGAWRLMKKGIIVKDVSTVETLGAATIICTDKTGTITENRMEIYQLYDIKADEIFTKENWKNETTQNLLQAAMWSSESVPFNPMEIAIHKAYVQNVLKDERPNFKMIHEYPLEGKPPMMTHVFEDDAGKRHIAVKGAPEAIVNASSLSAPEKEKVNEQLKLFAEKGLRVLGVGQIYFDGNNFPKSQQAFKNEFLGLIGFYDPPKENIASIFNQLYGAGIELKIITGDNPITTSAIAKQAHFRGYEKSITGDALVALTDPEFDQAVLDKKVFTRMYPEVKLRIIQSLKKQNEIVGMTGDGVNDGPALKAAHIGIAMGKRGSEIAKEASSIILTDDDFGKMVDAVAMGRKIYSNLKKAIQYIISIHIPIILTVALPLILGWLYPAIFTPVHVIFLELIMGPTCSIVYENEPLEKNAMLQPPRKISNTFFNLNELTISIIQGLAITAGTLFSYQYSVQLGWNEQTTCSMVFSTLIVANIFLTLVNRSFYYSVWQTFLYKNDLLRFIIFITIAILAMILYIPQFARFFKISPLNLSQIVIVIATAFISVAWFEIYKWIKRNRASKPGLTASLQ
ncbi:MAG: cation-translocating P-type ATPase [Niastella sp.]|nr:cation-translocating P-type ATPase [Niastella sp.]